jgi:hypothetical protein
MRMMCYIDPGTGSILFAVLIGILGAVRYIIRIGIVKLKFMLSGGKKTAVSSEKIPFVIYSDNKRYWNIFEPICRELDKRGMKVVYMTQSPDDPALNNPYENISAEFIGETNKAFVRLNFLEATMLLSTTPGLDVYQWKKSKGVKYYVHILHAAGEVVLYRMFGIDYYDALLLSGEYQVDEVRQLEKMRNLPEKECYVVGLPYMDEMVKRLKESGPAAPHERTVLLAPSWGPSAIFSKFGGDIIGKLLDTGYHVIVRPHPQSFVSEKEMLDKIMEKYPESDRLEWNRDVDNFEVLKRADILISDFSGVTFDFALVYDKPIIYADTEFDTAPYDAWWLNKEVWTLTALPRIGMKLTEDMMDSMKNMIDTCIEDPKYAEGRKQVRSETWCYYEEGTKRTVDWLMNKYEELSKED